MEKDFEFLDHTADFKFRAYGDTLAKAFENAGKALYANIVDPGTLEEDEEADIVLEASNHEELLHDFLSELIFLFEDQQLLFKDFSVEISGNNLKAVCVGESYDPERHQLLGEVKAVTYHNMLIEERDKGWVIEVLCDT